MVNKQKFIGLAQSLDGSYYDYGRCLYIITHANGLDEEIFNYMVNVANDVSEVDRKVYELLGEPEPLKIVPDVKANKQHLVAA